MKTHPLLPNQATRRNKDRTSRIARYLRWLEATGRNWLAPDFRAYEQHLTESGRLGAKTISVYVGTVRKAYRDLVQQEAYRYRITSILNQLPPDQETDSRHLQQHVVERLFDTIKLKSLSDLRNRLLLGLELFGGLSETEIAALEYRDLDLSGKRVQILVSSATGKPQRYAVIYDDLFYQPGWFRAYLEQWIKETQDMQPDRRYLFCSFYRDGNLVRQWPITMQSILNMVQQTLREATTQSFTPLDLRRTFARRLYDNHIEVKQIATLIGYKLHTAVSYIGLPDTQGLLGSHLRGDGTIFLNELEAWRNQPYLGSGHSENAHSKKDPQKSGKV